MDRDKLAKLMALTTSDNDGEALNAVRAANRLVKDAGQTWQDVLREPGVREMHVTVSPGQSWSMQRGAAPQHDWGGLAPHLKDKVVIDMMFRAVFAQPRGSNEEFWQFMDSIHNSFNKHGSLTAKQYEALKNCYRRVMRTAG